MRVKVALLAGAITLWGQNVLAAEWGERVKKVENPRLIAEITKELEGDLKDIDPKAHVDKCAHVVTYFSSGTAKNHSYSGICSVFFASKTSDVLMCFGTVNHPRLTIKFDSFSYSDDEAAYFVEANCAPGG